MIIYPPKLEIGDTIGVFSPSSAGTYWAKKRYERGKSYLIRKGFKIREGKLTGKSDYYRSGSIKDRADEFNSLLKDDEVKCIMSSIGGMNSNSLLPYIDYKTLKDNPKIIIGYSDVTALLLGIYAKIGLVTFYGPALVSSFGEFEPLVDFTYEYFKNILMGNYLNTKLPTPKYWTDEYLDWNKQNRNKKLRENELITVKSGICEGRLIGGNLNTFQGIFGSEYMPKIKKGDILFIEDSLLKASEIERSFSLLKVNNIYNLVDGIILGKHELFDDEGSDKKPYEILNEVLGEKYKKPFLAQFDCCHTHPMLTLPIGVKYNLNASEKSLKINKKYNN